MDKDEHGYIYGGHADQQEPYAFRLERGGQLNKRR